MHGIKGEITLVVAWRGGGAHHTGRPLLGLTFNREERKSRSKNIHRQMHAGME